MDTHRRHHHWLAAALLALSATAQAGHSPDPLRLQYERDKADCVTGRSSEPRNVCLREAEAAYAQARKSRHTVRIDGADGPALWAANALKRCEAHPPEDRELCERRVREGTVVGGVKEGGQLTTLTIRSTDIPKQPGG